MSMSAAEQQEEDSKSRTPAAFSLSRWFTTVGLLAILLLALIGAFLLSQLFEQRMLQQEGRLTMQFVQGVIDVEGAASYFERTQPDHSSYMEQLLAHIARSPDVLRTNLYSRDRRVIWSSDPSLTGRSFADEPNEELDTALDGEFVIHEEDAEEEEHGKAEHSNLPAGEGYFVELYVPVLDAEHRNVVGAVELYRAPQQLRETIMLGVRLIWAGAIGAALLLFLALLPLVRRADAMIRDQQNRIVEAEKQSAMGDLGSAVAHGIRNPLSVIRTSAEIIREGSPGGAGREAAVDIMDQVDRLEHWVRELLTYVHLPPGEQQPIDVESVARGSLEQFSAELRRRGIETRLEFAAGLARVRGDEILLGQVVRSVIANSVESMQGGGRLTLAAAPRSAAQVALEIRDTGTGMDEEQLARAFRPFHTTKAKGLGVGLPLAKRIVERMGGRISLSSRPGEGTTVLLLLPAAT